MSAFLITHTHTLRELNLLCYYSSFSLLVGKAAQLTVSRRWVLQKKHIEKRSNHSSCTSRFQLGPTFLSKHHTCKPAQCLYEMMTFWAIITQQIDCLHLRLSTSDILLLAQLKLDWGAQPVWRFVKENWLFSASVVAVENKFWTLLVLIRHKVW